MWTAYLGLVDDNLRVRSSKLEVSDALLSFYGQQVVDGLLFDG